jgi:hypothetical protein
MHWKRTLIVCLLVLGVTLLAADRFILGQIGTQTEQTDHFDVAYSGIDPADATSVAQGLESNYSRIGQALATAPATRIHVTLYDSRWAYARSTGHWGASGNIEGTKTLHVLWDNGRTTQNAIHEFAHAVTLKLLVDREPMPLDSDVFDGKFATLPIWLWEAVACYEANQVHDVNSLPYMQGGGYPGLAELSDRRKGQKIYAVGHSIIAFVHAEWGDGAVVRLLTHYGDLQSTLGVDEAEFAAQWNEYVRSDPRVALGIASQTSPQDPMAALREERDSSFLVRE